MFDYLLRERFGLAAITDHDRADTVAAIQQLALDKHLPVLVAVEMTTTSDSRGPDEPPIKYRAELSRGLLERVGIQIE